MVFRIAVLQVWVILESDFLIQVFETISDFRCLICLHQYSPKFHDHLPIPRTTLRQVLVYLLNKLPDIFFSGLEFYLNQICPHTVRRPLRPLIRWVLPPQYLFVDLFQTLSHLVINLLLKQWLLKQFKYSQTLRRVDRQIFVDFIDKCFNVLLHRAVQNLQQQFLQFFAISSDCLLVDNILFLFFFYTHVLRSPFHPLKRL